MSTSIATIRLVPNRECSWISSPHTAQGSVSGAGAGGSTGGGTRTVADPRRRRNPIGRGLYRFSGLLGRLFARGVRGGWLAYPDRISRLPVKKTYKLYIGGAFPRSESGRTYDAQGQN